MLRKRLMIVLEVITLSVSCEVALKLDRRGNADYVKKCVENLTLPSKGQPAGGRHL